VTEEGAAARSTLPAVDAALHGPEAGRRLARRGRRPLRPLLGGGLTLSAGAPRRVARQRHRLAGRARCPVVTCSTAVPHDHRRARPAARVRARPAHLPRQGPGSRRCDLPIVAAVVAGRASLPASGARPARHPIDCSGVSVPVTRRREPRPDVRGGALLIAPPDGPRRRVGTSRMPPGGRRLRAQLFGRHGPAGRAAGGRPGDELGSSARRGRGDDHVRRQRRRADADPAAGRLCRVPGGDLDASIAAAAILVAAAFSVLVAVRVFHWGRVLDTRSIA